MALCIQIFDCLEKRVIRKLFFFQNGKCAKVPLASYATKQNRRKLLRAYSDKEPLAALLFLPEEQELARDYLCDHSTPDKKLYLSFISLAMRSQARMCIIPLQDYLGLSNRSRMNTPSTVGKNWKWRLKPGQMSPKLVDLIGKMTLRYGRWNWA